MKKSRTVLAAMCGLLIAGPALASACLRPEERTALEARALRSYLMVAALNCRTGQSYNAPEGYNAFLRRFGSELSAADRVAQAHFTRAYGGQGRTRLDQYNTLMANEHSEDGIRAGSFFCRDAEPLFRSVSQMQPGDLARVAVERNIIQSYHAEACPASAGPAARPTRTARTARR